MDPVTLSLAKNASVPRGSMVLSGKDYGAKGDGTPHTQTRLGVTRTYAYSGGQLVSVS